jgi:DNA-directed RNA polymerase specialized sigma24 family protein
MFGSRSDVEDVVQDAYLRFAAIYVVRNPDKLRHAPAAGAATRPLI